MKLLLQKRIRVIPHSFWGAEVLRNTSACCRFQANPAKRAHGAVFKSGSGAALRRRPTGATMQHSLAPLRHCRSARRLREWLRLLRTFRRQGELVGGNCFISTQQAFASASKDVRVNLRAQAIYDLGVATKSTFTCIVLPGRR
jgi:hypothetical protein